MNDPVESLKKSQIGVMPTDTVYGIVGSALQPLVVEKIYQLKKRSSDKPFIILISSINDLKKFDVGLTEKQNEFLEKNWPNPLSVILPSSKKYEYLHRGKNSLAFRMPKDEKLLEILKQTGPLVAPSANFEGEKIAGTIAEAEKYFGKEIAFYVDGGKVTAQPSIIIQLNSDGSLKVLRSGLYKTRKLF
ncbi:threonylcarbamoyl-AMP synthase [Candidatus Daviesbacteria bacterium]|nr:threonylcarbamoyl-AMP synthase [Candidatus Daviesbacteria bacterium]